MKIEKMTARQFADNTPQSIAALINHYYRELSAMSAHPVDMERRYTKQELQQIAAALGTAARTIVTIDRKKEVQS